MKKESPDYSDAVIFVIVIIMMAIGYLIGGGA